MILGKLSVDGYWLKQMSMWRRDGSWSTLGDWSFMAVSVDHLDVRLFQPGHWFRSISNKHGIAWHHHIALSSFSKKNPGPMPSRNIWNPHFGQALLVVVWAIHRGSLRFMSDQATCAVEINQTHSLHFKLKKFNKRISSRNHTNIRTNIPWALHSLAPHHFGILTPPSLWATPFPMLKLVTSLLSKWIPPRIHSCGAKRRTCDSSLKRNKAPLGVNICTSPPKSWRFNWPNGWGTTKSFWSTYRLSYELNIEDSDIYQMKKKKLIGESCHDCHSLFVAPAVFLMKNCH